MGQSLIILTEESNLQALNQLTGAQVDLPPVTGLYLVENCCDDQGRPAYNLRDNVIAPGAKDIYTRLELRLYLYHPVYLSCSPFAGADCIVLLLHRHGGEMSYARVGEDMWTRITWKDPSESFEHSTGCRAAAYNKKDGLFYVLCGDDSIFALNLNGPLLVARKIIPGVWHWEQGVSSKSIVLTQWGDFLQVRRTGDVPSEDSEEVVDKFPGWYTNEIEINRVDVHNQKLVKMDCLDLQDHALFLGSNSTMPVSTKDFPMLKQKSAYLTDDNWEGICGNMYGCRDVGIWNFETETLESLRDVQSSHPWLNWPPPIWIVPSLS